ncbi:YetF domain-containing protein [Paenibacillus rhizoplanae]
MKKERYPIDNILQMLREVDIFDISEVDTAVLEANGKLTAFKKAEKVRRNEKMIWESLFRFLQYLTR